MAMLSGRPSADASTSEATKKDLVLFRDVKAVKSGQIHRFQINYTPTTEDKVVSLTKNLWVKVKNTEPLPMRAAFIAGPYLLYVDCRSEDYDINKKCFITADQPTFEPQLQPGNSFYAELSCHTIKDTYRWTVDVVSQMIFNNNVEINFEIMVGTSRQVLHEASLPDKHVENRDRIGTFVSSQTLEVSDLDIYDLWNLPIPNPQKPIHLVILTHGLHSNVSADMFYLKEQIDSCNSDSASENFVVKGFFGNICKTERGIKYLGSRVAEYIIDLIQNNEPLSKGNVTKISFVGHSLGGLVQTFTIAYLQVNFPWFFQRIKPINFITIASPMLGASNENPIYVNLALSAGIVGKTGQELSLRFTEDVSKPLLLLLPQGPTHTVLKRFVRRTLYSNVANDGVVPLRTSALLYLDHEGLGTILSKKSMSSHNIDESKVDKIPDDDCVGDNNLSFLPQPVQVMLSKFMPQKQHKTTEVVDDKDEVDDPQSSNTKNILKRIEGLHRSSVLETAQSLLLPPLPPTSYIVNPDERENAIIYDKVYHEDDLPPRDSTEEASKRLGAEVVNVNEVKANDSQVTTFRKRLMSSFDLQEFERIEEEIAREYHKDMSWRKVLVRLNPDAHNNIIVRRRFANAYGWPVMEHLINNHFTIDAMKEQEAVSHRWNLNGIGMWDSETPGEGFELVDLLSRDLIKKENKDIEETGPKNDHQWINTKDNESFFSVGPASLISDVGEMVGNLRDQWYTNQNTRLAVQEEVEVCQPADEPPQVMGDFL
ncbi:hypothetical protein PSN45_002546 [Yamadazyma tenuis]|uniref:DUF676 domain-containing protein n=1 Tax=Candida tenuis (strain ATCC 10573 / BCRC 21748 / CBS 615 / JCM 9827 / NBRC 10315 / NRRL Y-1498 / VKM Y-70) TaxID=590646 RepID=G3B034_CANTC|nr:uncharacterized protein CANTEDRAFT_133607 [Yamadazyma tenuis ATCC 10573]EGV65305.1 hypothetical protein CANTEDRAFT_133607 [Yamadazyma tenuis ATCC 10573]WEJ95037.1 hypothetical protein PSN45_002546 [Yamadazyma tenuis]